MPHLPYKSDSQGSSYRRRYSSESDSSLYSEDSSSRSSKYDSYSSSGKHPYKYKYDDYEEEQDDGRKTVEITGLEKSITDKDVEKIIRSYAIKYGFSPPTSVTLFANTINLAQNFITRPNEDMETNTIQVEFPSSSAVLRFLRALKIPKIQIKGHYYQVAHLDKVTEKNPADITITQSSSSGTIQMNNSLIKIFCDWNCPKCNFFNFSKRSTCLHCEADRPEEFQLQSLSYLTNISNLSHEYSSWIVVKDIPSDMKNPDLVKFLADILPDIASLERCYYFTSSSPADLGFLFAVFPSLDNVTSYFDMAGSKCTSQLCKDSPLRVDLMLLKERVVAGDLISCIKFEDITKEYFKNQYDTNKYCRVYSTSLESLKEALKSNDYEVRFSGYVGNWSGKIIWFPGGKTDYEKWPKDPITGYFYNAALSLYYDPKSCYYMLASGGYFVWDAQSSSLVRVDPSDQIGNFQGTEEKAEACRLAMPKVSESSRILEEAKKMAMASHSVHVPTFYDNKTNVSKQFTPEAGNEESSTGKIPIKLKLFAKKQTSPTPEKQEEAKEVATSIDVSPELICFVCLRYFDNLSQLDKHESLSEYHKFILSQS